MYTVFGEVKSEVRYGEDQNMEQMVRLWQPRQVMLGLVVNPESIVPKLLVFDDTTFLNKFVVQFHFRYETDSQTF
jgi:hypothetical protein